LAAGYALTVGGDGGLSLGYSVATAWSLVLFWFAFRRCSRDLPGTLPLVMLLSYMWFAYYVKFYWLWLKPDVGVNFLQFTFTLPPSSFGSSFLSITLATTGVTAVAFILAPRNSSVGPGAAPAAPWATASRIRRRFGRVGFGAILAAGPLIVTAVLVSVYTGVGVMGIAGPTLPFRMAGIIYVVRSTVVPALLLLGLWAAIEARRRLRVRLLLVTLLAYGVIEMLLRSSRGALVPILLSVAFLMLGLRKLRSYWPLFVTGALMVVVLHPLLSAYRNLRIDAVGLRMQELIPLAWTEALRASGGSLWTVAGIGLSNSIFRATGAEILIWYQGLGFQPLFANAPAVILSPRGLSGFMTVDVFGFPPAAVTAVAPGLVGWMYVVGGNGLVLVGCAAYSFAAMGLWRGLARMRLRSEPVAQALVMTWLVLFTMDGVLESFFSVATLAWPIGIAVCEGLARWERVAPPGTNVGAVRGLPN